MKSLIIHAGLHKTGSTSIQNFLGKHREKLAGNNLHYPQFSFGRETFNNHSAPLRLAFGEHPEKLFFKNLAQVSPQEAAAHFYKQFEALKATEQRILLSAEGFSQFSRAELSAFLEFFKGWEIQIILYVRPAYSYHCSAVQEQIKSGRPVMLDKTLVKRSPDIVKLQSAFDNIAFFHFPSVCAKQGPVAHFVDYLDLGLAVTSEPRDNIGMSNVAVRVANRVNEVHPIRKNGKYNPRAARFNAKQLSLSDGPFRLTKAELDKLRDEVHQENQALTSLTGIPFTDETLTCSAQEPLSLKQQVVLLGRLQRLPADIQELVKNFLLAQNFVTRQVAEKRRYTSITNRVYDLSGNVRQKWRAAKRRLKAFSSK